jgi:hypothetical protein
MLAALGTADLSALRSRISELTKMVSDLRGRVVLLASHRDGTVTTTGTPMSLSAPVIRVTTSGSAAVSSVNPSATFDPSSLTAEPNAPFTISGTAHGVVSVRVGIGQNGQSDFYSAPILIPNGTWSTRESMGLSAGTYNMAVYGFTDAAGTKAVTGEHVGEGGILTGASLNVYPYLH